MPTNCHTGRGFPGATTSWCPTASRSTTGSFPANSASSTVHGSGNAATAGQFFEFLRDSFDLLHEEGATHPKMMSVGLHCRLMGHPGRAVALRRFLEHIRAQDGVWICRRVDIARHWVREHPPVAG